MASFKVAFEQAEHESMAFLLDRGFRCFKREVVDDGTTGTFGFADYRATHDAQVPSGWGVTLSAAPFRLEQSLEISDEHGSQYTLWELFQLEGIDSLPIQEHGLYESATDPALLRKDFESLANVLRQTGTRFFAGDKTLWLELAVQRSRVFQEADDRRAIALSEQAFQSKDWASIVRLLEPIRERLSGASVSRLAYAKKRVSAT